MIHLTVSVFVWLMECHYFVGFNSLQHVQCMVLQVPYMLRARVLDPIVRIRTNMGTIGNTRKL